jgi:resuscitation-promoting factor RpfB
MRKLLVSVLSVGLLVGPAAVAFAQVSDTAQDVDRPLSTRSSKVTTEPLDLARVQVTRAAEQVEAGGDRGAREGAGEAQTSARSGSTASPQLQAIAQCESGGDYTTDTGNGFYGAYQFTQETWASVGGSGLPSEAPPAEQDQRAQMLLEQSGTSPWPVCGQ